MSVENPTLHDHPDGCLLCRIDKITPSHEDRGYMYMSIMGMATLSGLSWTMFINPCRDHAVKQAKGTAAAGEVLLDLAIDGSPPEYAQYMIAKRRQAMKMTAALEVSIMERYEQRQRELEDKE